MKSYRDQGAIGAILDEYKKALTELENVISNLSDTDLTVIVDYATPDPDCKSIQTILTHVIRSGYCYVIEIRKSLGENIDFIERKKLNSVEAYKKALRDMFRYNEQFFKDYPNIQIEELHSEKKILVNWGQLYDIEQLFEHAIVHILRHRRQIERFKLQLKS
ncbi:DinB family protein [Mangrovimonas sp. ST2L15]|uniref:DinB family protein n=1 Tax=Mangrovimonas sp. ST2L15 TaxID=1645916 RepID=UPI0006B4C551|nr:DinB family protein [Mangrovimonas sp. ST2L15]